MRFSSWLNDLVSVWNAQPSRCRNAQRRSGLKRTGAAEVLESKRLLAATVSLDNVTKELLITGTTGNDIATVTVVDTTNLRVRVFTGAESVDQTVAKSSVTQIRFLALAGHDKLTNFSDVPVSMIGGDGNDTLLGGLGNDKFFGGLGDDSLHANAGDDLAFGDAGNDTLFGAAGKDYLDGGDGNDNVNGAASAGDTVSGGLGDDTLDGGIGQDVLLETVAGDYTLTDTTATGQGNDVAIGFEFAQIFGTTAPNRIDLSGSMKIATLNGANGNDTLIAGSGATTLAGGSGADVLIGSGGSDKLLGQAGDDTLTGGLGNDTLDGNIGSDLIVESVAADLIVTNSAMTGNGADRVLAMERLRGTGGEANNLIDASAFSGPVTLLGGGGDDTLSGGSLNDDFNGGAGVDRVIAARDANFTATDTSLVGNGTDLLASIEQLEITGGASPNLINASALTTAVALIARGEAANDTIFGGAGNDILDGGLENDSLNGIGGNDTVFGNDGDDNVSGGSGVDACIGGDGNDQVFGLGGNGDTLFGGHGNDTLDGGAGTGDVIYEVANGNVTLDAEFLTTLDATFLTDTEIDRHLNIEGAILVGILFTNDRIDVSLFGKPTSLSGGGGGDDTIIGGSATDLLVEAVYGDATLGTASLIEDGTSPFGTPNYHRTVTFSGIDAIELKGSSDPNEIDASLSMLPVTLNGGGGNDTLIGGAGADQILGGAGDDVLTGKAGADTLAGEEGNDLLIESANTNLTLGSGSLVGAQTDLIGGFERAWLTGGPDANAIIVTTFGGPVTLMGGGGNDTLEGTPFDDSLNGGDGDDLLKGEEGTDSLFGEAGADNLLGGVGNDSLSGGAGNDRLRGELGTNAELTGDDTLDGGDGNDDLDGESGHDSLRGGNDNDTLLGGAGNDSLIGDDGNAGSDLISGGADNDMLDGGGGNDDLRGDDGADLIDAGDGNDVARGGLGNDTVSGSGGIDTLNGEAGDDSLLGGSSNDELHGGDGADTVLGEDGNDTLTGDAGNDSVVGDEGNDTLAGNDGDDTLRAGQGNDTLRGNAGNDQLFGDSGTDALNGDEGHDALDGGSENDTLFGDLGDDTLAGAQGNDELRGEAGDDSLLGGSGADVLIGADGLDTLAGGDDADSLEGNAGNDNLSGDNGNDTLLAADGDDTADGGAGNDAIEGAAGNDSLAGGDGNDLLRGVDGHDTLRGDGGLDTLMGMMGDDSLDGGAGADLVLGDFGSDTATGGADRDLVIGGQEADSINGGEGDDIVNGNVTKYDGDLVKLTQLLSDWNSAGTYSERVALLEDTAYPQFLEAMVQVTDGASVFDDYQTDTVRGDAGQDFVLRPGSAAHGSLDQTPDFDAATESLLASIYGTEDAGFFPTDMTQPGYLESLDDPTFGTPITRISDDAGTVMTLDVNTGGTRTVTWSGVMRNRYVTDSAWNVDGSLLMIRSYDPSMPYQLMLDGSTYEPQFLANLPSTNYRWSQNPAKPTHQWSFPQVAVLDADGETENGTAALLPTFGADDDLILEYDVTTGQVVKEIVLPFNKLFSSKTSIALVNGHEHLAVYGVDKNNPSAGISVYVVDLDAATGTNPVIASMLLTDANSGTPEANYSDDLDFNNLWFSPDGKQILTLYFGSTTATRSWRLLDVNAAAGTITSHAMPALASNANFQTLGDRAKGHFAINWSHPTFALGASGDVYVVGVSGQFNGRTFPQNEVATLNGQVGSVVAFNVRTNRYQSLTDPVNENLATHITATNTQTPGYLVVSYWNDTNAPRGPHFSGELVAINVEAPFGTNGTIELAHHRSNLANSNYHAIPLPNLSLDGTQLIFGSTWGVDQSEIATYVLDLSGLPAAL